MQSTLVENSTRLTDAAYLWDGVPLGACLGQEVLVTSKTLN